MLHRNIRSRSLLILATLCLELMCPFFSAQAVEINPETYATCKTKVSKENYGSSEWELTCREEFDMAQPYLLKCLRMVKDQSFPTEAEKLACRYFCKKNKEWGPWYDYEIANELKPILAKMKHLHATDQCL